MALADVMHGDEVCMCSRPHAVQSLQLVEAEISENVKPASHSEHSLAPGEDE
jgi:hypothetical protein